MPVISLQPMEEGMPENGDRRFPLISIRYEGDEPVDLISFTNSLARFGSQYQRFAKKSEVPLISEEYRLLIKEVRHGSIVVDLISGVAAMAPFVGDVKLFLDFGKDFVSVINYFLNKGAKPADLDRRKCEDVKQIVAPVAENSGSIYNFHFGDNASPQINLSVNSVEANAIQNRATREIESLKQPTSEIHEEVLLRWHRAENAPGAESGATADRAIIEEIDEKPRKVYFPEQSQALKQDMVLGDENFFNKAYLVDVEVMVTNRRIVGYKILKLHDIFDIEE